MTETYTITELAGEFEITPRTIRFYEDKELLRPRRNGMNRVYSRGDRVRLKLILRGKRLGFSLDEIKEMLDLYDIGDGQVGQLRLTLRKSRERIGALQCQRQDIDQAMEELEEGCRAIERMLADKGVGAHEV
jgi:DNA-binding transcriptional MerR regulator